jgi:GNAT superfamily N-acetyltransferase
MILAVVWRIMLRLARIEDTSQLAGVKEGLDAPEIVARFHWLSTVNVTWHVWWVADKPQGWALIQWNGKPTAPTYPDLFDFYVHPVWRGLGVGTRIIWACEEIVCNAGHKKLGLAVNPELNPRAYHLYQRLGYSAIRNDKYLDGVYDGVEDWVIDLEKNL